MIISTLRIVWRQYGGDIDGRARNQTTSTGSTRSGRRKQLLWPRLPLITRSSNTDSPAAMLHTLYLTPPYTHSADIDFAVFVFRFLTFNSNVVDPTSIFFPDIKFYKTVHNDDDFKHYKIGLPVSMMEI